MNGNHPEENLRSFLPPINVTLFPPVRPDGFRWGNRNTRSGMAVSHLWKDLISVQGFKREG